MVRELGLPLIDVHPAFEAHHDPLSLFPFRGFGHYNEAGHALVAQTVLRFIASGGASPQFDTPVPPIPISGIYRHYQSTEPTAHQESVVEERTPSFAGNRPLPPHIELESKEKTQTRSRSLKMQRSSRCSLPGLLCVTPPPRIVRISFSYGNFRFVRGSCGTIPASGQATRIAPLPCSKELFPIGFRTAQDGRALGPKVVAHYLLEKMRFAGVSKSYIVLRPGKWDIPAYFGDGSALKLHLAYLMMGVPFGVPFTLDQAYPFVRNATVAFGFPGHSF